MRFLVVLCVLTACPPPVEPARDTDLPSVDDPDPPQVVLTLDAEEITLLPGAATRVGWSADGVDRGSLPSVSVDREPCLTASVEEAAIRLQAEPGIVSACTVSLTLEGARASLDVTVEPDWGGRVEQWGDADVDWNEPDSVKPLPGGHLLIAGLHQSRGGQPTARIQRRDANGVPVGSSIEVHGARAADVARMGGVTWIAYRTTEGAQEVAPALDDGTLGAPLVMEDVTVRSLGVWDEELWIVGTVYHPETNQGGVYVGELSGEGELEQRSLYPAENSSLRVYGALRLDDGWLFHGLCYDHRAPCFPEAQGGEEWGSFLLRTDLGLEPIWVQGLGPGNVQVQKTRILEDGRVLVAGWARDRYHTDEYTGGYDAVVELREPTGEVVWRRVWGGTQEHTFESFAVRDDLVFLVGRWAPARNEPGRTWLIGLDLHDGSDVWEDTLGHAGTRVRHVLPHGRGVVVLGTTEERLGDRWTGNSDLYLARYGWDGLPR